MRSARLRYSGLGILLLGVTVALLMVWLRLSHVLFVMVASLIVLVLAMLLVARDGWRQTSLESLASRGMVPDSVQGFNVMDTGLRREMAPIIPAAIIRRMPSPGARRPAAPSATGARRRAAPSAGKTKPARSGKTLWQNETLQPDATITLAGERQAAGIDDLFVALDSELIGLVPVKKKVEEIGSLLLVDRARQRFGLSASRPNLHMCFTGGAGNREDHGCADDGRPAPPAWLPGERSSRACHAVTLWVSTSGRPRRRPSTFSSARWAACCSSTRPTPCTAPRTRKTTAKSASTSSCR